MVGFSQGLGRRSDNQGKGTPAWCIHVVAGQSIAANSSEITVGMKIARPRYRATMMLSRMTALSPQRVAAPEFTLITMLSFIPGSCGWGAAHGAAGRSQELNSMLRDVSGLSLALRGRGQLTARNGWRSATPGLRRSGGRCD